MRQLIVLAAALALAPPLARGEEKPEAKEAGPTSDARDAGDPGHMKGYGYGTPSGVEANASEGQAAKAKPSPAAQDEAHADSAKGGARGSGRMLHGTLAKVSGGSVSLRAEEGKVERLQISSRTTALRDGKRVPVSTLRAGEEVRASFEEGKNGKIATEIKVIPAASR